MDLQRVEINKLTAEVRNLADTNSHLVELIFEMQAKLSQEDVEELEEEDHSTWAIPPALNKNAKKFYIVTKGRATGVYSSYPWAAKLVEKLGEHGLLHGHDGPYEAAWASYIESKHARAVGITGRVNGDEWDYGLAVMQTCDPPLVSIKVKLMSHSSTLQFYKVMSSNKKARLKSVQDSDVVTITKLSCNSRHRVIGHSRNIPKTTTKSEPTNNLESNDQDGSTHGGLLQGNSEEGSSQNQHNDMVGQDQGDNTSKKKTPRKAKGQTNKSKIEFWLKHRYQFLQEITRLDGPGGHNLSKCSSCAVATDGLYWRTSCHNGNALCCCDCMKQAHSNLPFHSIEKWTGKFFEKTTLSAIGAVVQLGHDRGPCSLPSDPRDLQVLDVSGVHKIKVSYCDCPENSAPKFVQALRSRIFPSTLKQMQTTYTFDILDWFHKLNLQTTYTFDILDWFHKLNLQSKCTIYDFYNTILNRLDPLHLDKRPSRLSDFHLASRYWRHLKILKRLGRGHQFEPGGIPATVKPGELVVECPACPHPGKNLPLDWASVVELAFLYTLFVAINANFKLKGKEWGIDDVEMAPGWGVFVGESGYQKYIGNYVDQSEINTCDSEHDAVVQAAVRRTPGYNVTRAGLVICSNHCLVRPNGAGDLQKGEYCNMDYILFSAIIALALARIVITYDITCQWSRNLRKRLDEQIPIHLRVPEATKLDVAIPSWHINGHGKTCQDNFHVGYLEGIGKLCGDEIEQTWWDMNSLGASVREMGPAACHEVLNDHWNAFNFQKIMGFRSRFAKNLKEAICMRKVQTENFNKFSETFSEEQKEEWTALIKAWNENRTKLNPYEDKEIRVTMQDVRLKLINEEKLLRTKTEWYFVSSFNTILATFMIDDPIFDYVESSTRKYELTLDFLNG
ncbi:hypothetical protein FA15DRAFT_698625 [Coprinopsis marcescibilis]|uniref:CxC2-like cysteine cluster KDZ transposase-associated domain-containing protein n=1 Tax=Coprinopsis marcescibilis TaxID=230819 RepID=A0A5C3KAM1_COPMA|nr:hypothetical protein FA15DRAFT_698625 [Coprinopsis marcescibilis]